MPDLWGYEKNQIERAIAELFADEEVTDVTIYSGLYASVTLANGKHHTVPVERIARQIHDPKGPTPLPTYLYGCEVFCKDCAFKAATELDTEGWPTLLTYKEAIDALSFRDTCQICGKSLLVWPA
jgi:hypothetical protein